MTPEELDAQQTSGLVSIHLQPSDDDNGAFLVLEMLGGTKQYVWVDIDTIDIPTIGDRRHFVPKGAVLLWAMEGFGK